LLISTHAFELAVIALAFSPSIHAQSNTGLYAQPDTPIHTQADTAVHTQSDASVHAQADTCVFVFVFSFAESRRQIVP